MNFCKGVIKNLMEQNTCNKCWLKYTKNKIGFRLPKTSDFRIISWKKSNALKGVLKGITDES